MMGYTTPGKSPCSKEVLMTEVKGNLHISNDVIAEIVGSSVIDCYGVMGMSDPTASAPSIKRLTSARASKGVTVASGDEGAIISVYVILQYGVNISVVTQNIRDQIAFALQTYVRIPIESIDVHVTGIKVSK